MHFVLMALAVIAAVFALQLVGAAILAPPALVAQYAFGVLVRCCGEEVAVPVAMAVFLGLIGAVWYAIHRWQERRWRKSIISGSSPSPPHHD